MNFAYHATTNRLTSYRLNNVITNMTYDNNGNTLTEGNAVYSYDLRNNLISFSKGSDSATYTFNALGQRISKTSAGGTTYFVYDDATNFIGEYDESGQAISEHIGTPRAITNNANNVVWQWNNTDPFGSNLPTVETITYNKRFAGQYFDNESKLHYNYYRTYNPLIGRYIQSDPLGLAAGFNTYSYVESNPLGKVDPLGLIDLDNSKYYRDRFNKIKGVEPDDNNIPYMRFSIKTDLGTDIHVMRYHGDPDSFNMYGANCHGTTFADGRYWIDNIEVQKIINDEFSKLKNNDEIREGDVGIKRDKNGRIIHSLRISKFLGVKSVREKWGTVPVVFNILHPSIYAIFNNVEYYRENKKIKGR